MKQDLENKIYKEMCAILNTLVPACAITNVDIRLALSILYVERCQYEIASAKKILRKAKNSFASILNNVKRLNTSRGFSNIKPKTAEYAIAWQQDIIQPQFHIAKSIDLQNYDVDDSAAIRLMVLILYIHQKMWEIHFPKIAKAPALLGTLYNISDFRNKLPHNNPLPGGSCMKIIIDGEYVTNNFGIRTQLVYQSNTMETFMQTLENEFDKRRIKTTADQI